MKAILKIFLVCGVALGCIGCNPQDPSLLFCKDAVEADFDPKFRISCPAKTEDNFLPVKYGCVPDGMGISPPIQWEGVPEEATHLRILLVDALCVYDCNECCTHVNWKLDIPLKEIHENSFLTATGILEGADKDPSIVALTLPNTQGKRFYLPFCPPHSQTHAVFLRAIAYRFEGSKIVILGRTQSDPILFSFQHS